jgi:hypothetical protein
MNRKLLSAAVLAVTTALAAPLALADRDRDDYREVREYRVEERYARHDNGLHRGWYKDKHRYKDHRRHGGYRDYYERREYYDYGPHAYRDRDEDYYPERRSSSAAPIILGSVIGGVVGHEIGRGDPSHTAVGAVIGTVIGYDIARHRDR